MMKLQLVFNGMSVEEHAAVSQGIRYVCPDVAVSEIDNRQRRHITPELMGSLAGVVSAAAAVITLVIYALSQLKERTHPTPEEINIAIIKVEVMLQQELSVTLKEDMCRELQKVPGPTIVRVGPPSKEYLLDIRCEDDVYSINGRFPNVELKSTPDEQMISTRENP
jgi:hypothetical protein